MNIVRIAESFQELPRMGAGLAPTIYYLTKTQADLGMKIHVVCRRNRGEKRFERKENITVYRVDSPFSINVLNTLLALSRQVKVDIVHAHATTGFHYAISRRFWKFMPGRFVNHVHGTTRGIVLAWKKLDAPHLKPLKGSRREVSLLRENLIWRNSEGLLTNSQFLKKELEELYGVQEWRTHVIYNGVDLRVFQHHNVTKRQIIEKYGLRGSSKILLYLGGARLVKGPLILLEAFQNIHREMNAVSLIFVGKAIKSKIRGKLKGLTRELEKERAVVFLDRIPYLKLPYYYSTTDAVVVPSHYDAFPKVILEALACETPVVASNTGGIPEIITDRNTGLLFQNGDSTELAKVLISILTDSKLRERVKANGRKLIKARFTWDKVAERSLKAYNEILRHN